MTLSITDTQLNKTVIMLSVTFYIVMLNVNMLMLNVNMLIAIMLSVVAPASAKPFINIRLGSNCITVANTLAYFRKLMTEKIVWYCNKLECWLLPLPRLSKFVSFTQVGILARKY